jgi:hypothetical protein
MSGPTVSAKGITFITIVPDRTASRGAFFFGTRSNGTTVNEIASNRRSATGTAPKEYTSNGTAGSYSRTPSNASARLTGVPHRDAVDQVYGKHWLQNGRRGAISGPSSHSHEEKHEDTEKERKT